MGETATLVQRRLREHLAGCLPRYEWREEYAVGDTPVDVAGVGDALVLVELEWRRADPANNTAKLFRELVETDPGSANDTVHILQLFSRYYDLASGGVSTKRRNAAFVGERVAETVQTATYTAVTLDIDPPKRGGDLPEEWSESVEDAVDRIDRVVTKER